MKINKNFQKVWYARFFSILGTALTEFGLSVWVFSITGKATPMALTMLCSILPSIVFAPISGMLCDKFNRKIIILVADSFAALISFGIWISANSGKLSLVVICFFTFLSSAANTFDNNAYQASVSTLVQEDELKRANGMNQIIDSITSICAPAIAGMLYVWIGLEGIIIIDLISFCVSMILFVTVDKEAFSNTRLLQNKKHEKIKALEGFRFIFSQHSILLLLVYFTILNFFFNISSTLMQPYFLTVGNSVEAGFIKAFGGIGMLCGSLYVTIHKFKWKVSKIICCVAICAGIAIMLLGISGSIILMVVGDWLFYFSGPVATTLAGTIWLMRTPPELQGRVFALRMMIAKCFMPLSYLLAGPLVDYILPSLLKSNEESILYKVNAPEYCAVFIVVGMLIIFFTIIVYCNKNFRKLE